MLRGTGRLLGVVVVIAATLTVCGCDGAPSDIASSESPRPASNLESRSELLHRAELLYKKYLVSVQSIAEGGNKDFEKLRPLLSPRAYDVEVKSFERQSERGIHTKGPSELLKFQAQRVDLLGGKVVAYACIDLSKVRVLNARGADVTPTQRPSLQTFLPSFATRDGALVLEENGTWSGDSIC